MKTNCVYKNRCGGESCQNCKGYTTKTDIKNRIKEIGTPTTIDEKIRLNNYKSLLKGV